MTNNTINNVPRELLEFIVANARGVERERMDKLRALLTEQPQASAAQSAGVPDGWQLVPVEPTPAMLRAGVHQAVGALPIYRAMLSAAPAQPESHEPYPHGHPLHKAVFMARESYTGSESFEEGVRGLISELKEARKAQSEVQRLREALSRIRDHAARVMDDEVFYEADNALAASTAHQQQESHHESLPR